jgi:hypothetical protein
LLVADAEVERGHGVRVGVAGCVGGGPPGEVATNWLFAGFLALGALMVGRALAAGRILGGRDQRPGGSRRYVHHLAFNLIALFDGLVVITVLNGGVPGWGAAAVGVAIAGHFVADDLDRRVAPISAVSTLAPPTTGSRSGGQATGASSTPPAASPGTP